MRCSGASPYPLLGNVLISFTKAVAAIEAGAVCVTTCFLIYAVCIQYSHGRYAVYARQASTCSKNGGRYCKCEHMSTVALLLAAMDHSSGDIALNARGDLRSGDARGPRGASRTSTPAIVRGWPPPPARLASMRLFRQRRPAFFEPGPIAMPVAIRSQPFVKFERAIACARAFGVRRAVAATSAVASAAARVNDQGERESRKGFFLDAPGKGRTRNTAAAVPCRPDSGA